MQSNLITRLHKGDFKTLSPFKDDRDILRVGGRVDPTLVSYDDKRPALLPHDHHLSTLIIRNAHESCHSSVAATVAKIRRKYWIIKAHRIAKVIKHRCTTCRKLEAKVETQLMAALPPSRLQPYTPPFLYSTMDYLAQLTSKSAETKQLSITV